MNWYSLEGFLVVAADEMLAWFLKSQKFYRCSPFFILLILGWFFSAVIVVALGKVCKWAECKAELSGIIGVVFSFPMQLAWVPPAWHWEGCNEASLPGWFWHGAEGGSWHTYCHSQCSIHSSFISLPLKNSLLPMSRLSYNPTCKKLLASS